MTLPKTFRLRVPANPPVNRFLAVMAYGPLSRSLLDSGGNITLSSTRDPDKGFFVFFRFCGPLKGYIEKTWVMNDFEIIR